MHYFYDAFGRRLAKTTAEKTTVFVYDGQQVVAEYENGWLARSYIYGSYVDEPLALVSEQGLLFYTANHLYSVAALTDIDGHVVERYRYDAYGERTVTDAAGMPRRESIVGNQIGFTGRYHDPDSGLTDFRSRQYAPALGRFISRDQSYVDGMSLYAAYFVPNGTDPSGAQNVCAKSSAVEGPPTPPPPPPSLPSRQPQPVIPQLGPDPTSGLIIYGNYCGPGHGDDTGLTPAWDAVDAVCKAHDLCYLAKGYFHCGCDRALILDMPAAIARSDARGKAAGAAVLTFFLRNPCFCYTDAPYPCGVKYCTTRTYYPCPTWRKPWRFCKGPAVDVPCGTDICWKKIPFFVGAWGIGPCN